MSQGWRDVSSMEVIPAYLVRGWLRYPCLQTEAWLIVCSCRRVMTSAFAHQPSFLVSRDTLQQRQSHLCEIGSRRTPNLLLTTQKRLRPLRPDQKCVSRGFSDPIRSDPIQIRLYCTKCSARYDNAAGLGRLLALHCFRLSRNRHVWRGCWSD